MTHRILVVDDEPDITALVAYHLAKSGYRVSTAATGADALLIEVHPNPAEAWSDGAQQVSLDMFAQLMRELRPLIEAAGRE